MSIEEQAIQEIIQNIVQRGDGKVWMDDWRGRFGSLGPTPKDFMEQRPDLFQLNHHGRGFSVELVGEGEQMAKDMGAESGSFSGPSASKGFKGPQKGGPKGGIVLADPIPGGKGKMGGFNWGGDMKGKGNPKGGINLAAPAGKGYSGFGDGIYGGGGFDGGYGGGYGGGYDKGYSKGFGKKGKGGPSLAALSAPKTGELADQAIDEIKAQMAARGQPKVWIEDWKERYQPLGPDPKRFMESRPDIFNLAYEGTRYSVYLVEDGGGPEITPSPQEDQYWQGRAGATDIGDPFGGAADDSDKPDEQACIDEISNLVRASADGRIWIPDWFRRFAHLAKSPRAFMESRPDVFELTFKGNTYSVSLFGEETKTGPYDAAGMEPIMPAKRPAPPSFPPAQISDGRQPWKSQRIWTPGMVTPAAIGKGSHGANPRNWTGPSISPMGSAPKSISPLDTSTALDFLGDKEEDALAEIFDQLSKPYSNGKINFPDWSRRFGHLAPNPKEFIERHPDKFEVIPGFGGGYTVELC